MRLLRFILAALLLLVGCSRAQDGETADQVAPSATEVIAEPSEEPSATPPEKRLNARYGGPKPIAVLISVQWDDELYPSTAPTAAIYEDGQVTYVKSLPGEEQTRVLHKRLDVDEFAEVRSRLPSARDYSSVELAYGAFPADRRGSPAALTEVYLAVEGQEFMTGIGGLWIVNSQGSEIRKGNTESLPETLLDLLGYLTSLDWADATPWTYSCVEVVARSLSGAEKEPIPWPDDWPGLDSPYTLVNEQGDMYKILLSSVHVPRLRELLDDREWDEPVLIDGRLFGVTYRFAYDRLLYWDWTYDPQLLDLE